MHGELMKQAIINLLRVAGAFTPFRLMNRQRALILTYHRFSWGDGGGATSARAFAEQLAYLRSRYRLVPLSSLARRLENGEKLPPAAVAITIDDGYRDAYEVAFPILRRFDAPATLFVVTDFIDRKIWLWTDKLRYLTARVTAPKLEIEVNSRRLSFELSSRASRLQAADTINAVLKAMPDEAKDKAIERIAAKLSVDLPITPPHEFSPLTWDEVRRMDAAGVEIGSHSVTHPILTQITGEQLSRELKHSRSKLEAELGRKVDLFCYPNGNYDAHVRSEVAAAGYRCAVTTDAGLNDEGGDPLTLKRIHTERDLAHFIQATSGFEQLKNRLRRMRLTAPNAAVNRPTQLLREGE